MFYSSNTSERDREMVLQIMGVWCSTDPKKVLRFAEYGRAKEEAVVPNIEGPS